LFFARHNRGFAHHDPNLRSDQTTEARPVSVGQPKHTCLGGLLPVALATTSATSIAEALCEELRRRPLIVPAPSIVEDLVAAALTTAEPHVARQLTNRSSPAQVAALDGLLSAEAGTSTSGLAWARQPPGAPGHRSPARLVGQLARLRLDHDRARLNLGLIAHDLVGAS
jgi:hypothetical protein